jgi:predicted AlkP superfamily phosphohydrolase/phosphomutase
MLAARPAVSGRRVIVLGIDGMDPNLLREYMSRGEMPNFSHLAQSGSFAELATTFPPQSPVAWSTLMTGEDPGVTGIFDFIHRDPSSLTPYLSTSVIDPPRFQLPIGPWVLPLTAPRPRLLRSGKAFWQVLDDFGIDAVVVKMPANFPPAKTGARTLAGMGTPDLLGGYGTFSFYTDDPFVTAGNVNGGRIYHVSFENGRMATELEGPPNPFRRDDRISTVPFQVSVDAAEPVARIDIQGRRVLLKQGEWSAWVPLRFELMPHLESVSAVCRFYLKQVRPDFRLYVSPLNLDPLRPAIPISTPAGYAPELAQETGRFYTQGIAEDTKALSSGVLTEDEFLAQARLVFQEEVRLFEHELARFRQGVFFYYFSSLDENAHMTWRQTGRTAIEHLYAEMDRVLGKALAAADANTTVLVASDHGFASFARAFNLNAWLAQHDYLATSLAADFPDNIDWAKTQAYGLGLNALYINQKGREAKGIIAPGAETDALLERLKRDLLAIRDPLSGEPVFTRIETGSKLYGNAHPKSRPDLVLGYNRGYRAGWDTVLGSAKGGIIEENNNAWSGDHCIDPAFVPGVLLANRPIRVEHPRLADVAPMILREFGIASGRGQEYVRQ